MKTETVGVHFDKSNEEWFQIEGLLNYEQET